MNSALPPSMMSVPRPAMFVATVTAPLRPAWATIAASRACCLALRTSCRTPRSRSCSDRYSLFSTLVVPTSTGWPASCRSAMSSTTASNLATSSCRSRSGWSLRDHRPVGRDRHHAELVDRHELGGLGLGRTGHAGELVVHAEVVLQGDRGERLVLALDLARPPWPRSPGACPRCSGGRRSMRPVCSSTIRTSPFDDDVVLVALEQLLGLDRVVEEADERGVHALVEVLDAEVVLDPLDAGLQDADRALLLVDLVVVVALAAARTILAKSRVPLRSAGRTGREMISGVRASSIRIESTSSTIA